MAPTARSAPLENFEPFARRQKHPFACTFLACGFEHQKPKRCAFSRSGEPTQCPSVPPTLPNLPKPIKCYGEPQHYHDYPLLPRRRCPVNCLEPAISAIRAERESVVAPSRSPLVFLRQLVTREIQHLAHAAGARSRGVGSARDLVPRGDDAHLASVGRPRRCRSSCRLIGAWRSCTTRRGRRSRASSDSPGRPYESRACDPRRPSQASRIINASSPRPCRGR